MSTSPVTSVTDELIAELERSVECVWPETDHAVVTLRALLAERAELKRQLAESQKTLEVWHGVARRAERDQEWYRTLRDGGSWPAVFASSDSPEPLRGASLDAAMQP